MEEGQPCPLHCSIGFWRFASSDSSQNDVFSFRRPCALSQARKGRRPARAAASLSLTDQMRAALVQVARQRARTSEMPRNATSARPAKIRKPGAKRPVNRSEERRGGKEWVGTLKCGGSPT